MSALLRLMRPRQWVKNAFVLAPLIFSGQFFNIESVSKAIFALVIFCLASSATYIVNDIRDIEEDKKHPEKVKKRPLASGTISVKQALVLLTVLYVVIACAFFIMPKAVSVIIAYILLNLAYCFYFKYQPVIDIFFIAAGFVLRVFAGAQALQVSVSPWMFITTLCLALYLAAIKRRQELKLQGDSGRKVLKHYTYEVADRFSQISSTATLVFYSLFVTYEQSSLIFTVPLVLYGLFRYFYITETLDKGESPTNALLQDWQLLLVGVVWSASCIWVLSH